MLCSCGRGWDHCRKCGGRSIYRMQTASMIAGVDVWKCKRCMVDTSELTPCMAAPNRESKDFVSKEKAIRDLAKLPLEERLKIMIAEGASVEEVKDEAQASGLEVTEEPKPELVIQKAEPTGHENPTPAFNLDDLFKPKEPSKDE